MKKLILLTAVVFSLVVVNESIYGKSGQGKSGDRGRSEKSERDSGGGRSENSEKEKNRDRREKSEEDRVEKNQSSIDAQRNWGQLKKEFKDENGEYDSAALDRFFGAFRDEGSYSDKEIKEAIKAEKVVRREMRRNEEALPEGVNVERVINNYLYGDTQNIEDYLKDLEGFDEKSLDRMANAKEKYNAALDRLEEKVEVAANVEE